jgi:hypothetical protein
MATQKRGKPLSLREFGREIGVSHVALVKGIQRGRLVKSVGRNRAGRSVIVDPVLAREEWEANGGAVREAKPRPVKAPKAEAAPAATRAVAPIAGPAAAQAEREPAEAGDEEGGEADAPDGSREPLEATNLVEAQRLGALERARAVRLATDVKRGLLVDRNAIVKMQFESDRIVREAMLNIASRLSAELAAETDAGRIFVRIDAAIREALSSVAAQFEAQAAGE